MVPDDEVVRSFSGDVGYHQPLGGEIHRLSGDLDGVRVRGITVGDVEIAGVTAELEALTKKQSTSDGAFIDVTNALEAAGFTPSANDGKLVYLAESDSRRSSYTVEIEPAGTPMKHAAFEPEVVWSKGSPGVGGTAGGIPVSRVAGSGEMGPGGGSAFGAAGNGLAYGP